eukprot:TRINITY_DN20838_c0_g1_i1.p1 TRINITY_DN20838_c0_g1~~TRINITY_DN20838_c0_g1_i1.p1  ORF type:complete len:428 (-),score=49.77 TRINITY_DN20838_c0_g1_i1:785-2068(-)
MCGKASSPIEGDSLNFAAAFSDLIPILAEEIGWEVVTKAFDHATGHEDTVSFRSIDGGVMLARFQYVVKTCLSPCEIIPLPEEMPDIYGRHHEVEVLDVIAPGDAILSLAWNSPALIKLYEILTAGRLEPNSEEDSTLANQVRWDTASDARVCVRRNYPKEGEVSLIGAPRHPVTGDIVLGCGTVSACMTLIQESAGPQDHVLVSSVLFFKDLRGIPRWASPHFGQLLDLDRLDFQHGIGMMSNFCQRKDFYVILSLRGCSRGLPLFPVSDVEQYHAIDVSGRVEMDGSSPRFWGRAAADGFDFSRYLQKLVLGSGLYISFFNTLGCGRLVPYQACVRQSEWLAAEPVILHLWKMQSAAYRRLNGGKTAPQLARHCASRWHRGTNTDDLQDYYGNSYDATEFIVKKTFVELKSDIATTPNLPRSLSF